MRAARVICIATVSMIAHVTPSLASVTIGQLAPPSPPTTCFGSSDVIQPTVVAGNTYVVPSLPPAGALAITSWSTSAYAGAGQTYTLKVFHFVAGSTWKVVGHDGPHELTAGTVNTFPANLRVSPGDVLGAGRGSAPSACVFSAPGESFLYASPSGSLDDNQSGTFASAPTDFRVNISANVAPANEFTLSAAVLNKKRGTATVTATLPNPGDLSLSGHGVKTSSATAVPGTAIPLAIAAKGKKKRKLNRKGKVRVTADVTYTPVGGDRRILPVSVKLKKR
jgi:hypothetical protein